MSSIKRKNKIVYVPKGFAHGYSVLSETAIFQYKCTDIYHPEDEYGILWNDPSLKIDWQTIQPHISKKDLGFSPLIDVELSSLPTFKK